MNTADQAFTGIVQFQGFSLDFDRRVILRDGAVRAVPTNYWDALTLLVRCRPEAPDPTVFRATLAIDESSVAGAVKRIREAIGDRAPYGIIVPAGKGTYRFLANPIPAGQAFVQHPVLECEQHVPGGEVNTPGIIRHRFAASLLYASLFSCSVVIETAYEFNRSWAKSSFAAALVFAVIASLSVMLLREHVRQVQRNAAAALFRTIAGYLGLAAGVTVAMWLFLPHTTVTLFVNTDRIGQPAQIAFAKNVWMYYLPFVILYLVIPYHFIIVSGFRMHGGDPDYIGFFSQGRLAGRVGKESLVLPPSAMGYTLLVLLGFSFWLTYTLFDGLSPRPGRELLMWTALFRNVCYFALGVECLLWYRFTLAESSSRAAAAGR